MLICPRYERARWWNVASNRLSPSVIFDTKKQKLTPHNKDVWYEYARKQLPSFSGSTQWKFYEPQPIMLGIIEPGQALATTNINLSSNYTAGSAGNAIAGFRWNGIDSPITDVYFYIPSFTGTAANVNDVLVEIRSYDLTSNLPLLTAPGLLGSGVVDPGGTAGWAHLSGLSISPTYLVRFYVIIGDPDGNGTDFAVVTSLVNIPTQFPLTDATARGAYGGGSITTTGGFASANTFSTTGVSSHVLVRANGGVEGQSIVAAANHTSNSVKRGLYVGDVPFSFKLFSMSHGSSSTGNLVGYVFDEDTLPAGSPLFTSSNELDTNAGTGLIGVSFARPFPDIHINNAYRFVFDPSGNTTNPVRLTMGTGSFDDNLRKARPGYGEWYYTDEDGGSWTDTEDELPNMGLLIEDISDEEAELTVPSGQRTFPRVPTGS